jgi:hypothetical protein
MTIGSLGLIGGFAGAPLAQRSADGDKVQQESVDRERTVQAAEQAEAAAGIGQTEEDGEAQERDADGRRLWERPPSAKADGDEPRGDDATTIRSKDPTGACGRQLDLDG